MGRELYGNFSSSRRIFEMGERLKSGITEMCFSGEKSQLTLTQNAQPCLFLTDLACAAALSQSGIRADMAAGFSLGEIPALSYAGVLSAEEGFSLVLLRGAKMAECAGAHPGGMVAVLRLETSRVEELCASCGVYPVNYNCKGQIVCAGCEEGLKKLCEAVRAEGGRTVRLAVSGAFHTPYMQEAAEALSAALGDMYVRSPSVALYSNLTAGRYPSDAHGIKGLISAQCANGVRWEQSVLNMLEDGADTFIEVGPGTTLCGLIARIAPSARTFNVSDVASLEKTVQALKQSAAQE